MKAKRYSTEFKSSIVALYNEGHSANSLANEYHLAVQTVTGWVKKAQIIGTDVTDKPVTRVQSLLKQHFKLMMVLRLLFLLSVISGLSLKKVLASTLKSKSC